MWRVFLGLFLVGWYSLPRQVLAQPIQFQHLSVEDGLSHNHITAIVKDERGFMWFGTPAGLSRYDGHEVKVFRHTANRPSSLADNDVLALFSGPHGKLWVKTKLGIHVFDSGQERFVRNGDSVLHALGLPATEILDMRRNHLGQCWILQRGGVLSCYREKDSTVSEISASNAEGPITGIALDRAGRAWAVNQRGTIRPIGNKASLAYQLPDEALVNPNGTDFRLFMDSKGRPWVYAAELPMGVYWWPDPNGRHTHLATASKGMWMNNQLIFGIAEDPAGNIWIATDHGGINLIDPKTRQVSYLLHDKNDDRTISQNSSMAIHCDREGIMWIGTFKRGVSYHHPHQLLFALYQRQRGQGQSALPFDDINQLLEDPKGNVWIGTNGGGLVYFDRKAERFTQYRHDPADPQSLGSDVIVKLFLDRDNVLWIGTYHGGLNRFDGKHFTRYTHDPNDPRTISDNSAWEIHEDRQGRFWVGTLRAGLNRFDKKTGRFDRLGVGENGFTASAYISDIAEDNAGRLWFGTASGVEILQPDGTVRRITYQDDNPAGLGNDHVNAILQDRSQRIWIATRDGLSLYDARTDSFRVFRTSEGLVDNTVMAVVEDHSGAIWVTTARGISAVRETAPGSGQWRFWNYDHRDGLQGDGFNEDAACVLATGELLFAGPSGFNVVDPAHIQSSPTSPVAPVLTDFQLFNRSVDPAEWLGRERIALSHDEQVVGFVVASLYFRNQDRAHFRYQLDGFDPGWMTMDRRTRTASFTNLDPGDYRFRVMVSEDGEHWSEPFTLAALTVSPPFWKTGWAYTAYLIGFVAVILSIRHIERTREKTRFALQRERQEARSKLDNVLKQKATLEQANRKKLEVFPTEKPVLSIDEQFLRKVLDTVENHLGNSDFSVEVLADAMHVSRVALYKRLVTLTGHTPSEFIRNIRLRRAAQLLEQSGLTVSEIAYEVGFSNPKQFSGYFKQLYGVVPSAYRK